MKLTIFYYFLWEKELLLQNSILLGFASGSQVGDLIKKWQYDTFV